MSYEVRNEEDSIAVYVDGKEVGRYAVVEDAEKETEEFRAMLDDVARWVRRDMRKTAAQLRRLMR